MNPDILVKLEGVGLWVHSITEAATLAALGMYYSGSLDIGELDFEPKEDNDPRLVNLLEKEINILKKRLTGSIEANRLKSPHVQRNIDDNIIEDETYIDHDDLIQWLISHGVDYEDGVMEDWERLESEITSHIVNEVVKCRLAQKEGRHVIKNILNGKYLPQYTEAEGEINIRRFEEARINGVDPCVVIAEIDNEQREKTIKNYESLYESWKEKVDTIDRLTAKLRKITKKEKKYEPVMAARSKRTLLTIIAALCNKAGIPWEERGAAQLIQAATQLLGAPVSDDTILKIIKDIPEALDSRMK
ncbi:MAG: hypothetical protein AB7U59_01095 [Desulfovibrionaceae bacterium]